MRTGVSNILFQKCRRRTEEQGVATDEAAMFRHNHHIADLHRPPGLPEILDVTGNAPVVSDQLAADAGHYRLPPLSVFPLPQVAVEAAIETALEKRFDLCRIEAVNIAEHRTARVQARAAKLQQHITGR